MLNKLKLLFILFVVTSCHPVPAYSAEQTENWYGKAGTAYVLNQAVIANHSFTNYLYSVEGGIQVNTVDNNSYRFGLYYFDHIGMDEMSTKKYSARMVEVFGEHFWNYNDYYLRVGMGYKFYQDAFFQKTRENEYKKRILNGQSDRLSARFAIGKRIGKWEVELAHHSNWLVGAPFNDKWEYHQTSLSIGYVFDLGEI